LVVVGELQVVERPSARVGQRDEPSTVGSPLEGVGGDWSSSAAAAAARERTPSFTRAFATWR
jgi:hypothetical protein